MPRGPDAAGGRRRVQAGSPGGSSRPQGILGEQVLIRFFFLKAYLPRKEVIQPHVPVRLPCYDFTPLALHTFDASLTRLGRRLRVQTTRVV